MAAKSSTGVFRFADLSPNLSFTIGPSNTFSLTTGPCTTFYPTANSTSDLRYFNHKNMSRGLHSYIIVLLKIIDVIKVPLVFLPRVRLNKILTSFHTDLPLSSCFFWCYFLFLLKHFIILYNSVSPVLRLKRKP